MMPEPACTPMGAVQVVPLVRARAVAGRRFDYLVPERLGQQVRQGSLVEVPFGGRRVWGVVVDKGESGEVLRSRLRPLLSVAARPVPSELLELADHLRYRYLSPLNLCLHAVLIAALPFSRSPRRSSIWVFPADTSSSDPSGLSPKQTAALASVPRQGVRLADLCRTGQPSRAVIRTLVAKKRLMLERREDEPPTAPKAAAGGHVPSDIRVPPRLSREQEEVLALLRKGLSSGKSERKLLWGITGSGKTEVYLRLLVDVAAGRGGAILLVPEIALTVRAVALLRARLGNQLAVLHSGLPSAQRRNEYRRVLDGEARIIVGARSAVFAPAEDLRLIVVDEAHDASYKQEEEPRYEAREVAWWRIRRSGGLLVEVSATPRLESLRLPRLELRQRPSGGRLPTPEIIDMRREAGTGPLAPRVRAELRQTLARQEQAVIFVNRRGYASYLRCEACGEVLLCPHCEVSLTYHRQYSGLLCHQCGEQVLVPPLCPFCGKAGLSRGGSGTERIVEELLHLVDPSRLFRLDSDVATSGARIREVLDAFSASRPGVLVGTQMVAKGHDYPHVTLALVADADTALYSPDFRAAERTFQLLVQVCGRAGRGSQPGKAFVQTWNPDIPCIRMALDRDAQGFYRRELHIRQRLGYPPYRELVRLVVKGEEEDRVSSGANYLATRLRRSLTDDEIKGPARLPALRKQQRSHILVFSRNGDQARLRIGRIVDGLRDVYTRRGLDIAVDVDPQWLS